MQNKTESKSANALASGLPTVSKVLRVDILWDWVRSSFVASVPSNGAVCY